MPVIFVLLSHVLIYGNIKSNSLYLYKDLFDIVDVNESSFV